MDTTLFIEAYALDEFGDGPLWAKVRVDDAFLANLNRLHSICRVNKLESVTIGDGPDEWDMENDLLLRGDSLVVWGDDFWFTSRPKHADYSVESRAIDVTALAQVLNGKQPDDSSGFHWRHGLLFYAGNPEMAKELADEVCAEFVIYSANESALSDGGCFWSNETGWVSIEDATRFAPEDTESGFLPIATGQDARWVPTVLVKSHYG